MKAKILLLVWLAAVAIAVVLNLLILKTVFG